MILVTGGTGLVGAHLLYKLTNSGEQVRAIYRNERKLINVKNVFSSYTNDFEHFYNQIDWVFADILDIPALDNAFQDISYVYHCAAFVSFEPDKYHTLRRTNIEGTANIVNFCIDKKVKKLCYVSSIATMGSTIKGEFITEDTHWNPEEDNSVYSITKYGAEMEVWRATQEGLKTVIINPGVILGAGIWHNGSGSLFKRAYNGIKYYTKGTVGLIAIDDVTSIMIKLMNSKLVNERFILVAETWTYERFLQGLSKSVNKKGPKKLASSFMLNIAWKADWLIHILTGSRRQLTKHIAQSLQTKKQYSSKKIEDAIDYSFKSIDQTITNLGVEYLKQVQ